MLLRTGTMPAFASQPLTVAMLIQRYHPHVGGAERQLLALGPRLLTRGIRPLVLTRRLPGTDAREMIGGVRVYRLPARGPKLVAASSYLGGSLELLWRYRHQVHVLHAHELLSPATIGLAARALVGRPLVVKVLRGGALSDLRALRRRPLGSLRWALYRRGVDRFIALSTEIAQELACEGVPAKRIVRIPNGVDVDTFAPVTSAEKRRLRQELGLPDVPTAIFAGRLAPEKRVEALVRVWSQVRQQLPDAQLLILGEGPVRPKLLVLATAGVQLLGGRDIVTRYLQASDVFALPSVAEGLSNAMLEAMACGLCCVVHPHGGAVDAIRDGLSGRFLPDDSDASLARVLIALLGEPEQRRRIGKQARAAVVQDYSLETTADKLAGLYRELAGARRGG